MPHPAPRFSALTCPNFIKNAQFTTCALVCFFVIYLPSYAQHTTTNRTLTERQISENVIHKGRLHRIDEVLERYIAEEQIAGAVAIVLRDGDIVYERALGWADHENGRSMTTETMFRIASQTKAITSVAILMLVEQGLINLHAPIDQWMPTFSQATVALESDSGLVLVPAKRSITIKDLLTHTSGISYGRESLTENLYAAQELGYSGEAYGWYTAHKEETICETMDRLGPLPFPEQPGEKWVYGYNTDILGCIVERASGQPLDTFFREHITGPLRMANTHFFLPLEKKEHLAAVYTRNEDGRIERSPEGPKGQGNYLDGPRRNFSGGAGLLSTARDYARFLEMVRNQGTLDGIHYLSPHTVALMTSNQVGTLHSTGGLGFGLGFQTVDRIGAKEFASIGSFGWSGAYGSVYEVDPTERLVMVLMIQVLPYYGNGIRESFKAAVYQALVPAGN